MSTTENIETIKQCIDWAYDGARNEFRIRGALENLLERLETDAAANNASDGPPAVSLDQPSSLDAHKSDNHDHVLAQLHTALSSGKALIVSAGNSTGDPVRMWAVADSALFPSGVDFASDCVAMSYELLEQADKARL